MDAHVSLREDVIWQDEKTWPAGLLAAADQQFPLVYHEIERLWRSLGPGEERADLEEQLSSPAVLRCEAARKSATQKRAQLCDQWIRE